MKAAVVVFVLLFAVLDDALPIRDLVEKQLIYKKSLKPGKACELNHLKEDNGQESDKDNGNISVQHGAEYRINATILDQTFVAKCVDGQWVPGATIAEDSKRVKRFISWLLTAVVAAGITACILFCRGKSAPPPKEPPRYTNCPPEGIKKIYYAERGTTTTIEWSSPVVSNKDGRIKRNAQLSDPKNGQQFEGTKAGQKYLVRYEAVDNDGLKGYCSFEFTVKVRMCSRLQWPRNGNITCGQHGPIYGSTCTYSCDPGYELKGPSTSSCTIHGRWTGASTCSRKKCRPLQDFANGYYKCEDSTYGFLACGLHCNQGFKFTGNKMYIQCRSDGTWSNAGDSLCQDKEPPTLHCDDFRQQTFYADYGVLTTTAVWNEPTATDSADPSPVVTKIKGPSMGDVLPKGIHDVDYKATDSSGNLAICTIKISVEVIDCKYPLVVIGDDNMRLDNCSDSSYHYGVVCNFSCQYNLPLEGTNSTQMICEKNGTKGNPTGFWKFGNGSIPYCREVTCPELDPPENGALVYETVNRRPVVTVMCNEKFDIPLRDFKFTGQIFCYDSGNWHPVNKTPDCTAERRPNTMRLPSALYYYSGNCPDNTTMLDIKKNFLEILSSVKIHYNKICPSKVTCTVDRVSVECGQVRVRRAVKLTTPTDKTIGIGHTLNEKEESHAVVFKFEIVTTFAEGNNTYANAFTLTENLKNIQKEELSNLVRNGTFNIEGLTLRPDSFEPADDGFLECEPGTILDGIICKPCARGMYLNEETNQCTYCPVGQYADTVGVTQCDRCPEGYGTQQLGSTEMTDCKKLCQAGSVSSTRLEPCVRCRAGTYQSGVGMKKCIHCPHGQTTALGGSTELTQCQDFDVLLTNTHEDILLETINLTGSVSIVFWTRPFSRNRSHSATMKLVSEQGTVLSVNMSKIVSADIGQSFKTSAKWTHVSTIWDRDNSTVQVFIDGEKRIDEALSSPSYYHVSLSISAYGSDGMYMTGLHMLSRALSASDIASLLSTCTNYLEGASVFMDSFLRSNAHGYRVITPSICDAIDECASSPCGTNECLNGAGDFTCICTNGMSGKRCEIPPDFCIGNDCKNGATCNSLNTSYNCSCTEGYSGTFCEVSPVNGHWSSFTDWSDCSVVCDGGTRTRTRSCDNPTPGIGGLNCSGPFVETESCNTEFCRECGEPRKSFGVISNCTSDVNTGMTLCGPFCREDTLIPPGLEKFDLYSCGPETDYQWTPFDNFPACVVPEPPKRYNFDVEIPYGSVITSKQASNVESKVRENLAKTECFTMSTCKMSVSLADDGSGKKTNGSTMTVSLGIPITHTGDLGLEEYVSSETISPCLQEVVNTIVVLELTAADLQENSSTFFNVEVDGERFNISESNFTFESLVDCLEGSVPTVGVCAPCPYGSRSTSKACLYCNVGTYQDEIGQTLCKQCPRGLTTMTIGSSNISDCIAEHEEEEEVPKEEVPTNIAVKTIATAVGCAVGVFVLIVVVVLVVYKKRRRTQVYRLKKVSDFEIGDIRQPSNSVPKEADTVDAGYEEHEQKFNDTTQSCIAEVAGETENEDRYVTFPATEENETRRQLILERL